MSKPFRVAQPGRNTLGQYSPAPIPSPATIHHGAQQAGLDVQTYVERNVPAHDHLPQTPWPAATPGASRPMRVR